MCDKDKLNRCVYSDWGNKLQLTKKSQWLLRVIFVFVFWNDFSYSSFDFDYFKENTADPFRNLHIRYVHRHIIAFVMSQFTYLQFAWFPRRIHCLVPRLRLTLKVYEFLLLRGCESKACFRKDPTMLMVITRPPQFFLSSDLCCRSTDEYRNSIKGNLKYILVVLK